ncbi:copper chaperone PCu(A)C [Bradyrhizobium sp. CB3481]|uniref:copper chaperone PCu(A)C n=1 Tax=Bradyrhizobium sp. CB3481 TaxID=3039158 RepID=UPI0024B0A729|nr:copper chaperone PCu(A)C [Bradyrhizobium sp. CB3481]WFU14667.1 copper chaperone PCu(A)C [Bradyrhizobium sp. CB3481]
MWGLRIGVVLLGPSAPIAICVGIASALAVASAGTPLLVVPQQLFAKLDNVGLLAIPSFMDTNRYELRARADIDRGKRIVRGGGGLRLFAIRLIVGVGLTLTPGFAAAGDALKVTNARVAASDQIGIDLPLLMTIRNDAAEADAILRIRCPFANFSEKHTVDRGEGAPAMRTIKSIPIPENETLELRRDGYHVMLLQTRQKLVHGETFTCAVVFQKAGTKETEVHISRTP